MPTNKIVARPLIHQSLYCPEQEAIGFPHHYGQTYCIAGMPWRGHESISHDTAPAHLEQVHEHFRGTGPQSYVLHHGENQRSITPLITAIRLRELPNGDFEATINVSWTDENGNRLHGEQYTEGVPEHLASMHREHVAEIEAGLTAS